MKHCVSDLNNTFHLITQTHIPIHMYIHIYIQVQYKYIYTYKGKVIPLQAQCGPGGG